MESKKVKPKGMLRLMSGLAAGAVGLSAHYIKSQKPETMDDALPKVSGMLGSWGVSKPSQAAVGKSVSRFKFTGSGYMPRSFADTREPIPYDVKVGDGNVKPKFAKTYSRWVSVEEVMNQSIESNYWQRVLEKVEKYETLIVVSKSYNMFWLFENRLLIKKGPVGIGNESAGNITPVGDFRIHRKEREWHTSGEFEGADMGWAVYFSGENLSKWSGVAVHSSGPRFRINGGQSQVKLGDSNKCVNVSRDNAKIINRTLMAGKNMVVVLD
jgi:hypothetical protein